MLRRHNKEAAREASARLIAQARGQDRLKVPGTITESPDAPPGATGPTFLATADPHDYVIDVPMPDGSRTRATVSTYSRIVQPRGGTIHVEVDTRTGEVTVDHHAMSLLATRLMKEHAAEIPGSQAQARARGGTPDTFDPLPGATPAAGAGFADPGRSAPAFDVPPLPEPTAGSQGLGSFDFGPGQGSTEQKLARLRQLLDKGILTESEYQAQRQQVIDGG